jgi:hypothetical protein
MRPATTVSILSLCGWLGASEAWAVRRVPQGGPGCVGEQAEHEPNDTAATASLITVESGLRFVGIYGAITVPGDVDWFRFPAAPGTRVWLSVDTGVAGPSGSRDSVVSIFAPDGVTLIEEDDDDGTGNGRDNTVESLDASLVAGRVLPAGGTYYARVRAKAPGATIDGYSLYIAFTTTSAPEVEPNNTMGTAQQAGQPIMGSLSSAADEDWYLIGILDNGFPFVAVDGDPERDGVGTDVTLMYGQGLFLVTDSSGAGGAADPPAEGFAFEVPYGWVRVTGTGPGTYLMAWWQSGDLCTVPVRLQRFEIE